MAKSHLIICQKFEITLDIIGIFWEIWLDIVLNTSFFGAFRACFRMKITIDYRPKIRNNAWYYIRILGDLARYRLKYIIIWAFGACFRLKITWLSAIKIEIVLDIIGEFWADGNFFYYLSSNSHWTDCFFFRDFFFLVFSPRKRIFWSKSSQKLKVQKWCLNGSNSII